MPPSLRGRRSVLNPSVLHSGTDVWSGEDAVRNLLGMSTTEPTSRVTEAEIEVAGLPVHVNLSGQGRQCAVLLIHGSGPGATALSNWRFALPALGERWRCSAPDLHGFGRSGHPAERPNGLRGWLEVWLRQCVGLLDALGVERAHVVGNSLGGGLALRLLDRHPYRFDRAVLMGSTGVAFRPPPRLVDACHFYDRPDVDLLAEMVRDFVYDPASIGDDVRTIAEQRWAAVMDGENRLSYESMFEGDLQAHADALVVPDDSLAEVSVPVLLTHGRHDRYVPLDTSFHLVRALPRAQLHVFDRCGHWIQIERRAAFHRLVGEFLSARLD